MLLLCSTSGINISLAGIYRPGLERLTDSHTGRAVPLGLEVEHCHGVLFRPALRGFVESRVHQFDPVIRAIATAPTDNLNDTAFNQDTANTAAGINGAGPTPGIGLNSFYGPWLERIDVGLARSIPIREGKELQFQVQAFNLFNHANYYVQNGDGINQLQYNPIGTNCGDGATFNQTCYLAPNSGPGNFGTLQEISPNGLPRVLQFSARFLF